MILLFPYFILLLFLLSILMIGFRKWKCFFFLLSVAFCLNVWSETFALNVFSLFPCFKRESDVTVMTFNIHASGEGIEDRWENIASFIVETESDIVLLNEFETLYNRYDDMLDSLLLKYYTYSTKDMFIQKDNVFYSKFPISHTDSVQISSQHNLPIIQVNYNSQNVTLVGCHLSSNNYINSQIRFDVDSIKKMQDTKMYWQAINNGYALRRKDVDAICNKLQNNYNLDHVIILGDFNDIGGSYAIKHLESLGLYDAWWKRGFGYGNTFKVGTFSFRLDHILYSEKYREKDIKVIEPIEMSDHKAVISSFKFFK